MSYHHLLVGLCVGYSKEEVRKAIILDPEYSQTGAFMQITLSSSPNTHSHVVSKTPSTFT